jgi:hypothetical protein
MAAFQQSCSLPTTSRSRFGRHALQRGPVAPRATLATARSEASNDPPACKAARTVRATGGRSTGSPSRKAARTVLTTGGRANGLPRSAPHRRCAAPLAPRASASFPLGAPQHTHT